MSHFNYDTSTILHPKKKEQQAFYTPHQKPQEKGDNPRVGRNLPLRRQKVSFPCRLRHAYLHRGSVAACWFAVRVLKYCEGDVLASGGWFPGLEMRPVDTMLLLLLLWFVVGVVIVCCCGCLFLLLFLLWLFVFVVLFVVVCFCSLLLLFLFLFIFVVSCCLFLLFLCLML